jgi:monoamine oxidase
MVETALVCSYYVMNTDVAVIGAGAAGIAAARQLQGSGLRVQILEARDRVGGRAHTTLSHGVPADLGAAWLHFAKENAWTTLATEMGCNVVRTEPGWSSSNEFAQYYAAINAAATAGRDVAVSDIIPDDPSRPRFDAIMTWAVGVESSAVSTMDLARYAESENNWSITEGLGEVVKRAARQLSIALNTVVTTVDWRHDEIRITTSAGRLDARALIVTVPTSVLASDRITFLPKLPAAYTQCFEDLPLGVANKVFFHMKAERLPFEQTTNIIGNTTNSRTASYTVWPAGQPLLMAYFGGDLSRELEARGALADFAREELRPLFGAGFTSNIESAVATSWGQDPFALGSYSAAKPGKANARGVLSAPLTPRIWFAGEACSSTHYGTLHGAWQSGVTAARAIASELAGRTRSRFLN